MACAHRSSSGHLRTIQGEAKLEAGERKDGFASRHMAAALPANPRPGRKAFPHTAPVLLSQPNQGAAMRISQKTHLFPRTPTFGWLHRHRLLGFRGWILCRARARLRFCSEYYFIFCARTAHQENSCVQPRLDIPRQRHDAAPASELCARLWRLTGKRPWHMFARRKRDHTARHDMRL